MRPARIVVFAKAPVAGRAKTRLIPALGADGAARLAGKMLSATLSEARASGLPVELCGDPDPAEWGALLPTGALHLSAQGEGDLGRRLARAARRVLGAGEDVLLIGADCPELRRHHLAAAAAALAGYDAVLHPARDGGYVLLGLRRFDASVFEAISWSTTRVAEQTLARIAALGWKTDLRETLADVDEPGDLGAFRHSRAAGFPLSRE